MAGSVFTLRRFVAVVAGGLLLLLPMALPAQAAAFTNGSFETPVVTDPLHYQTYSAVSTAIPGWTVTQGSVDLVGIYWQASDGNQSVDLDGTSPGQICQTFTSTTGGLETATFDLSHNPDGGTTSGTVNVLANGVSAGTFTHNTPISYRGNMEYQSHAVTFPVSALTPTTLCFESLSGTSFGPVIDNVQLTLAVPCTRTVSGTTGAVTVQNGEFVCIDNATVSSVTVQPGGRVLVTNSTLNGALNSNGATGVEVCSSTVNGSTNISNSTGPVVLGDDNGGCPGNTFKSGITLTNNHGGFEVFGNTITGTVSATGNTAPVGSEAEIENNNIGGGLSCSGNTPPPDNDGAANTVTGARTGQCSAL